ncbi:MAG: short-chain dehydrogenase/reductase [Verrucomicrobia bacterium]|nr:short-chain dehydrogenase/reductase [Verrucomicrobiota bacterium]
MPSFPDQVAVITGGAGGLGYALGVHLARLGVRVALLDIDAGKAVAKAATLPSNALGVGADVTDHDACARAVAEITTRCGRIDIWVNAAGITGKTALKSHEVDLADFDRVMAINVRSCLVTTRLVLPVMLKQNYGRVLHVASIAGKEGNAGMVAYSTSKAAVIGLTKAQGKEYADTGITVNAIAPAVILTEMHDTMPQSQIDYMTSKIPMGRCGTRQEFAEMATFIVSPACSFTTGFTFDLSGGRATY